MPALVPIGPLPLPPGYETTANAVAFCIYLLAQNPDKESKLLQEIDAFGDGVPPSEDLAAACPYALASEVAWRARAAPLGAPGALLRPRRCQPGCRPKPSSPELVAAGSRAEPRGAFGGCLAWGLDSAQARDPTGACPLGAKLQDLGAPAAPSRRPAGVPRGSRDLTHACIGAMRMAPTPGPQACFKEALRLFPPAPLPSRVGKADMDDGGYLVPKNTFMHVSCSPYLHVLCMEHLHARELQWVARWRQLHELCSHRQRSSSPRLPSISTHVCPVLRAFCNAPLMCCCRPPLHGVCCCCWAPLYSGLLLGDPPQPALLARP